MQPDKLTRLRKIRTQNVMSKIGGLLDEWDNMPNDEKDYLKETWPNFIAAIMRIRKAAEG